MKPLYAVSDQPLTVANASRQAGVPEPRQAGGDPTALTASFEYIHYVSSPNHQRCAERCTRSPTNHPMGYTRYVYEH